MVVTLPMSSSAGADNIVGHQELPVGRPSVRYTAGSRKLYISSPGIRRRNLSALKAAATDRAGLVTMQDTPAAIGKADAASSVFPIGTACAIPLAQYVYSIMHRLQYCIRDWIRILCSTPTVLGRTRSQHLWQPLPWLCRRRAWIRR